MITPATGDALIIVHVQNDFLPGGSLAVPNGEQVIPAFNRYITMFSSAGLPIIVTRDWHPANHCSFNAQGGPWPPHCIAVSPGADFPPALRLPTDVIIISSATSPDREAYSGFEGTNLAARLHCLRIRRLFIGGLATEYCVASTIRDALAEGFDVIYLRDATRAINVRPDDGRKAEQELALLGAIPGDLSTIGSPH